jgi:hypothetical protein
MHRESIPPILTKRCSGALYTVPVLVLRFIPKSSDGHWLDAQKAPNFYEMGRIPWREKIAEIDQALIDTHHYFEAGTRYRAYRNPAATPCITYPIVGIYTIPDLPPASKKYFIPNPNRHGVKVPFPDWFKILESIDAQRWIEQMGVRQIWVWSTDYSGNEPSFNPKLIPETNFRGLSETNMAGPFGNVSNSYRFDDLPVYKHTYTVYQFNLHRSVNENVHNHIHQIESLLNHIDGRDTTPHYLWPTLLFWGRFVGADYSGKLLSPRRCGWCHYPPNASQDYSYQDLTTVKSDLEDWTPDGSGRFKEINAHRWQLKEVLWHELWMQSLPGANNGLMDGQRPLTNWWDFIGDWDKTQKRGTRLVESRIGFM